MSNIDTPKYPGSIHIDAVEFDNGSTRIDITNLVLHIDINSDITISSSFAEIGISDMGNFLRKFGWRAGDGIVLKLTQNEQTYERRYKIKSIKSFKDLENGKAYLIKGISYLEYISLHKVLSKSYSGKPSEIANTILTENTEEGTRVWEESSQQLDFISPTWSPIKCLQYLASKSTNTGNNDRMFFFQDSAQFYNLASMSKLKEEYADDAVTYRYYANTTNKDGKLQIQKMQTNIKKLSLFPYTDMYNETNSGNIKNTFVDIDVNSKTMSITTNTHWDTYKDSNLNSTVLWNEDTDMGEGKMVYRYQPSNVSTNSPFAKGASNDDFTFSRAQQIEIVVPGSSDVDIGHVVNIEIPEQKPDETDGLDPVWSGLYYIVSKRDSIDTTGHMMALRLVKDSLKESI